MTVLVERDDWTREERHRVQEALARARKWQRLEPHKCDFWTVVDETLLANYPSVRFDERDGQLALDDFNSGGASA
ncbi:hypothetical protein [Natrinema thermotolerans]|uniref:hypothetical protein n=1 Tax=Natrinema thermotolerans TaxID=121872 RepID=UPI000679A283|nr:hypothetical protein [Natrinema thermotolerans]QCC57387.1 hypothetical protein DVR14_01515 [Natrinema thermotolerans]